MWVDQDVLTCANELGEGIDIECIENLYNNDEPQEIYQWFIVTSWLHEKLSEQGDPVAEWKGQYWWGRTCYGQGIEIDGTFQEISRSLGEE
jgi:hypothetical protein